MSRLAMVLLPGLDGTGKLFNPLITHLPEQLEPIVVSYPPDDPLGYEDLLPIVRESLPVDRDFIVLGESFSGPLAVRVAHENPSGLKGVVLCATFASNPFRFIPSWVGMFSMSPIYRLWPVTIKIRAFLGSMDKKELMESVLEAVRSVAPRVIAARVRSLFHVNVANELRHSSVPVLYIEGMRDRLIRTHNVRKIRGIKPDIRVRSIDVSHLVLQLAPEEAIREIMDFLDESCHGP